jgi:phosphate transport system permease protein
VPNGAEVLARAGPPPAARPSIFRATLDRRLLLDRLAGRAVTVGGMAIIAAILAILVVIVAEVVPLFRPPRASFLGVTAAPAGAILTAAAPSGVALAADAPAGTAGPPLLADAEEYREIAWFLDASGTVRFVALAGRGPAPEPAAAAEGAGGAGQQAVPLAGLDGAAPQAVPLAGLGGAAPASVACSGEGLFAAGTGDGRIVPFRVGFEVSWEPGGGRRLTPSVEEPPPLLVDPEGKRPIRAAACAPKAEEGLLCAALLGPADIVLHAVRERRSLIGETTREETRLPLPAGFRGEASVLALDGRGDDLFVGTARGQIARYDLRDRSAPRVAEIIDAAHRPGASITVLGFLLGDRTLVAGDAAGGVSTWQMVRPSGAGRLHLVRVRRFRPHEAPVAAFSPSRRDKGFATLDATGLARLHYGTTGKTLLEFRRERVPANAGEESRAGEAPRAGEELGPAAGPRAVVLAPKGDGLLLLDGRGGFAHWEVQSPHPEVTLESLFGKVPYEGYDRPELVWQSTGGTDDFEAKFSLTPLIFGTLKGTLYALLFAVPLALLGALYASQFMHPSIRAYLKPTVEIMAALPSVVLGFLAGLWLAPSIEKVLPGMALAPFTITGVVLVGAVAWRLAPAGLRGRLRAGGEMPLLIPLVILGAWIAFVLGGRLEEALLAGDYRAWLAQALGLTYDQRNSVVVGIVMGFAVIPVIFTIAEDSLANVPQHLAAGSLALGATRWQTALRVVLPTASPGIFSAVMIGFGRAVGETMIVLMATGNTPVMDWSPFNGFRALSANIAVELPEAPEGGTLFRVLFLAALLLFAMTFAVNTAAEVVRLKLRERYRTL